MESNENYTLRVPSQQTLLDLEYPTLLEHIVIYTKTEWGKKRVLELQPLTRPKEILESLKQVNEFLSSFQTDNQLPNHRFDAIDNELQLLSIENSVLSINGFQKMNHLVVSTNSILKFVKKFKEYFPHLFLLTSAYLPNSEVPENIQSKINKFGEIQDKASEHLKTLRDNEKVLQSNMQTSFLKSLQWYSQNEYLDSIGESIIDHRRVLAVKSMYRKKVKGRILGHSKSGSISFIEPQSTYKWNRELDEIRLAIKDEIERILKTLTQELVPYAPLLYDFQGLLTHLDVQFAKAKHALSINALLPTFNEGLAFQFTNAYHPLLLKSNERDGLPTHPQSLALDENRRIIVISGPNAGGKSITLKTIGLLQIMLQSGMLIPVHERSTACFFKNILTDIGDNQSIDNHLSTYSYRLKQMRHFLKYSNKGTLILIDEFGTGSDPELGGALAETFLEEFFEKGCYGLITTHYANLKLLAQETPSMLNANMEFNQKSLQPTFKLVLGQAGSSFTFEVAQKNGIPFRLINRAKKKLERGKMRFDKSIARLQKERFKLEKTEQHLKQDKDKQKLQTEKLEILQDKLNKKLEDFQALYDANQKQIALGRKFTELATHFQKNNNKKQLLQSLFKMTLIEVDKNKDIKGKTQKNQLKNTEQEVQKKIKPIREKRIKEKKQAQKKQAQITLKVGDKVRLKEGKATGHIEQIEKNKAKVNYGLFMTTVGIKELELAK